jgi:hypothetical protein
MKSPKDTTPPTARLPTRAEMHEMADRAFLKAIRGYRRPPPPAEHDDIFAEGMTEALAEVRAKAPPRPTPELVAKDPASLWRWMEECSDYYCLEGLKEGRRRIEKYHRKKLVDLIKARAWDLAAHKTTPGHA